MEQNQSPQPQALFRTAVYVDGFNLYFGLRTAKLRRLYWLDIHRLATQLLRADQTLAVCKYFTSRISAPVPQDVSPNAVALRARRERQSLYLEALATNPNLSILYGQYLSKPGRCYACGATWPNFEEKMTDVNIATELLTDAFTDRFDTAIIVSADSDLVPPIRAICAFFPGKRIVVAFPPARASKEMRSAAHASLIIGHGTLAKNSCKNNLADSFG